MPYSKLRDLALARDSLLLRIVATLQSDARVAAAWLSGSFGRNEADEWADYDLHVVIEDDSLDSFLADRPRLYASIGEVILLQDEIPGERDVGRRFHLVNFAGPIEVDWSFLPASQARKPVGHKLLFESRPFPVVETPALTDSERRLLTRRWALSFWAMAPIAIKYAGRGETRRAASQTDLLSRALISLWRLLEEPNGPDPWQPETNRPLEEALDYRLPRLGQTITPARVLNLIEKLCGEARVLAAPLEALGASTDPRIVAETEALIQLARRAVTRGRYSPASTARSLASSSTHSFQLTSP